MKMMIRFLGIILGLCLIAAGWIKAEKIGVITPYLGNIENTYKNDTYFDLQDSGPMKGVYLQVIDTKRYQTNIFLYKSEDINYSTIIGSHFIFDYYLNVCEKTKNVIGAGMSYLQIDMSAESEFSPIMDFELENAIYSPYIRLGRYYYFDSGSAKYSIMPWAGYEYELVRGNLSGAMLWFPFLLEEDIEDDQGYLMTGININAKFYHFINTKIKYSCRSGGGDMFDTLCFMGDLYLNRNWGLSYRFKYFEITGGSNMYNMFGLIYSF